MTKASDLARLDNLLFFPIGFKNRIINGNFDYWQRGTTQSTSGYGSDDRWKNEFVGSGVVHTQQAFDALDPKANWEQVYYSRTVVTSVTAAGNYAMKSQRIEGVKTLRGKTAVISFLARTSVGVTKQLSVEFVQSFGTSGASSAITGIGVKKITINQDWQEFIAEVDLPTYSGKTITHDNCLMVNFWFDAGSDFAARTDSLGHQSGTFEISRVQLENGSKSDFELRSIGLEQLLCHRYYEVKTVSFSAYGAAGNVLGVPMACVWKFGSGAAVAAISGSPTVANCSGVSAAGLGLGGVYVTASWTATGVGEFTANVAISGEIQ